MAAPSSTSSVLAALAGNTFITVLKFAAFALSGSGAMLSEAIHTATSRTGSPRPIEVGEETLDEG
jgi:solute carrier family 30 (zinc transporter), member 9